MNSFGWGISIGKGSERKRAEEAHFVCDFVQYSGAHKTHKLNPHGIGHKLNNLSPKKGQISLAGDFRNTSTYSYTILLLESSSLHTSTERCVTLNMSCFFFLLKVDFRLSICGMRDQTRQDRATQPMDCWKVEFCQKVFHNFFCSLIFTLFGWREMLISLLCHLKLLHKM